MVKNTSPQGQWAYAAYVLSPLAIPPKKNGRPKALVQIILVLFHLREKHAFHPSTCFIMMECIHPLRVTCRIFAVDHKESSFSIATGCGGRIIFQICMLQSLFSKYLSIQIEGRRIKRINSATSSRSRMRAFPLESLSISISMIKHHHKS